jgi:hypothetical protein
MAVTKITSTLGEITTNFILNDFDVYLMNTSATGGYVSTDWALLGFTGLEKNMTRTNEKYRKEGKIPRVQQYVKTIRKGLTMTFDLSNYNEDLIALFTQGTKTDLGATGTQIDHGTSEAALEYRTIRLASTRDDGKHYCIDIPKAELSIEGETTFGGESESVIPLSVSAVYNPNTAATKNLYSEMILTAGLNPTAVAPVGY